MTICSVLYVPAGESIDAGVGEKLWNDDAARDRFLDGWERLAEERLGVPVVIAHRPDFVNASKLEVTSVDPELDDTDMDHEVAEDALNWAFEEASCDPAIVPVE